MSYYLDSIREESILKQLETGPKFIDELVINEGGKPVTHWIIRGVLKKLLATEQISAKRVRANMQYSLAGISSEDMSDAVKLIEGLCFPEKAEKLVALLKKRDKEFDYNHIASQFGLLSKVFAYRGRATKKEVA